MIYKRVMSLYCKVIKSAQDVYFFVYVVKLYDHGTDRIKQIFLFKMNVGRIVQSAEDGE